MDVTYELLYKRVVPVVVRTMSVDVEVYLEKWKNQDGDNRYIVCVVIPEPMGSRVPKLPTEILVKDIYGEDDIDVLSAPMKLGLTLLNTVRREQAIDAVVHITGKIAELNK